RARQHHCISARAAAESGRASSKYVRLSGGYMIRAFVFPGQGSQAVGMGRALAEAFPAAKHVFQEVDDALNQKLSKLMFEGHESDLTLTENAQPALMAVSQAVLKVLETEGKWTLSAKARFVAGHSLGEYS